MSAMMGGDHGWQGTTEGRARAQRRGTRDARALGAAADERPGPGAALPHRARLRARGSTNQQVAAAEGVHQVTVGKWRSRFCERRLDGLHDEPRPGKPRTIARRRRGAGDHQDPGGDAARCDPLVDSLDGRGDGMSQSAVSRIWRAFGLKPHQLESFKLSTDPLFIEKVRDIVGLYLNPPEAAVVLCACEKTQVQALERTAPILPLLADDPGAGHARLPPARHDQPLRRPRRRLRAGDQRPHRAPSRRGVPPLPEPVDRSVPEDLDVHVIVDNSSTHKTPAIHRWLLRHPRFSFHFTPTYSSWLNLVERWFAELTERWLRRGSHRSRRSWSPRSAPGSLAGTRTRGRSSGTRAPTRSSRRLAGYCERISDSGH